MREGLYEEGGGAYTCSHANFKEKVDLSVGGL